MFRNLYTTITAAVLYTATSLGCAETTPALKVPEMPKTPEATRRLVMDDLALTKNGILFQHENRMYFLRADDADGDGILDLYVGVGKNDKSLNAELSFLDLSSIGGLGTVDYIAHITPQFGIVWNPNPSSEAKKTADYVIRQIMPTVAQTIRLRKEQEAYGKTLLPKYGLDDKSQVKRNLEKELETILKTEQ